MTPELGHDPIRRPNQQKTRRTEVKRGAAGNGVVVDEAYQIEASAHRS